MSFYTITSLSELPCRLCLVSHCSPSTPLSRYCQARPSLELLPRTPLFPRILPVISSIYNTSAMFSMLGFRHAFLSPLRPAYRFPFSTIPAWHFLIPTLTWQVRSQGYLFSISPLHVHVSSSSLPHPVHQHHIKCY